RKRNRRITSRKMIKSKSKSKSRIWIPISFLALNMYVWLACFSAPAVAETPADPTYWQDIRPVLRKNCTVCHSAKNLKELDVSGGLALDSYAAIHKGSNHPVIEPGTSGASVLV